MPAFRKQYKPMLDALGIPDYDNYNLSNYTQFYEGEKVVMITGSRGCVRNCKFCNVNSLWATFKWRTGKHIVKKLQKYMKLKELRIFILQIV